MDHNFVPLKEECTEEENFSAVRESLLIKKMFYENNMLYCFDGINFF